MIFLSGCADTSGDKVGVAASAGTAVSTAGDPQATAAFASAATPFLSSATPGNSAYKVGPQDVLDLTVFQVPELTRSVQVSDGGRINLPLIGDVQASGKTASQIEHDIAARLGGRFLQSPQVSIFVKEYNSQRVTVEGAVKKPGVYPMRGQTTLMQLIAQAEGLDRDYASSSAAVFRQSAEGRSAARFDIESIQAGKETDPEIQKGDVVVIGTSGTKVFFSYFAKAIPLGSLFRPF